VIQVLDDTGQRTDEFLLVRYGATPQDWEEASNDKSFVELIDGMLIMHSPTSLTHSRLFGFLHPLLVTFVQHRQLGEVLTGPFTMELSLERKFEPDLMYLADRTRANLAEDRLHGPADLAIEIASPSTRAYDRGLKRDCYRVGDVRE
jgi:Uma2 family endonuclease